MTAPGLVFEEPPPPQRVTAGKNARKDRPLRALSDYIAPDSRRAHGTYIKYVVERCRCDPCRAANSDYETRRQHAMRRPDEIWLPYVPAGPARRHVRQLMAAGVGLKQIAKVSGVPHGSLSKLVYGDPQRNMAPSKRIRPQTERAILAVTEADAADGAKIAAGPTWALIDQLIAAGYWKAWIARQIGQRGPGLQFGRDEVTARTARAVAALHAEHIGKPPPKRASRWDAR